MQARNLAAATGAPTMEWDFVRERLAAGIPQAPGSGGPDRHTAWLTSLDGDGGPHVTGLGVVWHRDAFWFETGAGTRKGRNIARDPRCALSIATTEFDLVVHGRATQVTDPHLVAELAAVWAAEGWPAAVDGSGTAITAPYSAQSAGPPPWHVYRIDARSAYALGTVAPYGATRWTF